MDARDKQVTDRARAIAGTFGLEVLAAELAGTVTAAEWRAWAELPASRRIIGFLAEGLATAAEAAEVADTKRRHMTGMRPETLKELSRTVATGRIQAEIYRKLLAAIGAQANRQV